MTALEPLITVIVPVYNRADIVAETLDSIAAQTERPLSLVIVDNNSSDASLATVTEWAERNSAPDFQVKVVIETAKGAAAARNRGAREAASPYVMFFDSDDIMLPDHVKDFADAFRADRLLDIAGRDVMSVEIDGSERRYPFADRDIMFRHLFNATLSTQRYAVRTELFRRAGGWNSEALGWDDYELGIRLLVLNPTVKKIDGAPSVVMRRLEESITGTDYASGHDRWEHALDLSERTLLAHGLGNEAIELRRIVLAALYRREKSPESSRLLGEVLSRCDSPLRKMIYRFAYIYTAAGGRGIHLLLRRILKIF